MNSVCAITNVLASPDICQVSAASKDLTAMQTGRLNTLIVLAVLAIALPAALWVVLKIINYFRKEIVERVGGRTLLLALIASLVSVGLLRYSVGLYRTYMEMNDSLLPWEEISNSVIHALQTFSMDEDYTGYFVEGKEMVTKLWGEGSHGIFWFDLFVLFMNVLAPVLGGAMLLDILTSILPGLKLLLFSVFPKKYYFSKLNDRSLALAESIAVAYKKSKNPFKIINLPVIIFCDVYVDKESEKESELYAGAKAIGAICVRDDLVHIWKGIGGRKRFFLIDDNDREINNLKLFSALAEKKNAGHLKYSEVFLFSQSNMHTIVEAQVYKKLKDTYLFEEWQLPTVVPVKCYQNLVTNLLADLPLYEPLVDRRRASKNEPLTLEVSILGGGVTGREMLMSVYWMGQMLNCKLKVNVFSKETEKEFYESLNYINPDIRANAAITSETVNEKDGTVTTTTTCGVNIERAYCTIYYKQCRVDTASFFDSEGSGARCLRSDYVLVALGSDELNIEVANKLREEVGKYHLIKDKVKKTVITYVVYNSCLCDTLNEMNSFDYSTLDNNPDIYMKAVGSLKSVYSVENVFCSNYSAWAMKMGELYNSVNDSKGRRDEFERKRRKDDYTRWADRARAMHVKYKIFSAGYITTSVFDTGSTESPAYKKAFAEAYLKYCELAKTAVKNDAESREKLELLQKLAWLEHRRWMAFMRIMGFSTTTDCTEYMKKNYFAAMKEYDVKQQLRASLSIRGAWDMSKGMKLGMRLSHLYWAMRIKHCMKVVAELSPKHKAIADEREKIMKERARAVSADALRSDPEYLKANQPSSKEKAYAKRISKAKRYTDNPPAPEHKNIPLKLHPCMQESEMLDPDITPAVFMALGNASAADIGKVYDSLWAANGTRWRDALDEVSYNVSKRKEELQLEYELKKAGKSDEDIQTELAGLTPRITDYKQYDYPCFDIDSDTEKLSRNELEQ